MTQPFDAYYKWLGIAPEEQPPSHYRLLGIRAFEEDPDVIEAAADQRMAHLRNYQAGKHSELSQKLLNEVAAAKICLLHPQKKSAYDASLRAELEANSPQAVAIDPALADLFQTMEPVKAWPLPLAPRKKPSSNATVLMALSAIGGLLILGLLVWIATRPEQEPAKSTVATGTSETKQATHVPPAAPKSPGGMREESPAAPKTVEKPSESKPSPPVQTAPIAPLDPATVRTQQQRGAKERGVPVEITNSIGLKLVFVPAGEFEMGTPFDQIERWLGELQGKRFEWHRQQVPMEAPPHRVRITQPFYLGVYEVTQAEYQQIMGHNPSAFAASGKEKAKVEGQDTSRHPVENVNWDDAVEFCRKLSALPAEQAAGRVYRLPTEAEWEYACRAGTRTQWYCGADPASLQDAAWFSGCNSGMTHPVGQKSPNGLGVYDLHGNVAEWCMDWFAPDYYAQTPPNDPQGPSSGTVRAVRGGAWWAELVACRSAFRHSSDLMLRDYVHGFRVVCTPGKATQQPPVAQAPPDDKPSALRRKPVGRWTFDDPKNPGADSSGLGCYGKVFGATFVPDGKAGGALSFEGEGGIDFEQSKLPKSLDFKEMSVSWWVNISHDSHGWRDWWAVAGANCWLVGEVKGEDSDGPYGTPALYGQGPFVAGDFPKLPGTGWHHLAATANASSGKLILHCDGKELGASGQAYWLKGQVEKLAIGYAGTCRRDGKPAHVDSLIDDVQFYDYALNAEEVQFLWTHPGLAVGDTAAGTAPAPSPSQKQTTSSTGQSDAASTALPPKKHPLPSDADQQELLRQVDEVYKLAEAKTRAQKLKRAKELLDLGRKPEGESTERFVLLRRAMETASDGGDAALMLQAVDAIAVVFEVDLLAVQEKVLLKFAEEASDSAAIKSFVESSRGVIDRAFDADRYELALNLATAATRLGMKPTGREYRKPTYDRRQEIQALADQWKKLEEARAVLTKTPDDPAANLALGPWFCLEKGDWSTGLPHLAKGSDEGLKKLATEEQSSPPTSAEAQLKLADAWWNLAESRKGREKDSLLLHAASWYQAAHAATTGLVKVKVDKRLADAAKLGRPIPKLPSRQSPPPAVAPFSASEARQHQERWAKHLGMSVERTNSIGMKLVLIPPGEFEMGSSEVGIQRATSAINKIGFTWASEHVRSEGPRHHIHINRPLFMGACEVTVGQFRRFVEATAYQTEAEKDGKGGQMYKRDAWKHVAGTNWCNPGVVQTEDCPVGQVSWNDAVAFCQWLSRQENATYRLPTEAEWEYACRAGTTGRWSFGDREEELDEYAWYDDNSGRHPNPVGQKKPNPWGLYDMHGSVYEWCSDWASGDYYRVSPVDDPRGPASGDKRVYRGGSWDSVMVFTRAAFHRWGPPELRNYALGFRVACDSIRPGDAKENTAASPQISNK